MCRRVKTLFDIVDIIISNDFCSSDRNIGNRLIISIILMTVKILRLFVYA